MTPHPYDGCDECVERTRARLRAVQAFGARHALDAPTKAQLEKHAKRFGPALVVETAAELGVTVNVDRAPAKRTRTKGPTLKERVAEHVAEGRNVELIAELENLSPSRARRIVQEVSA